MANETDKPQPRWRPVRNLSDRPGLGLIVSEASEELAERFFVEQQDVLRNYFILTTWGTYSRCISKKPRPGLRGKQLLDAYEASKTDKGLVPWTSTYPWLDKGYVLRPGKVGGIIQMAEHLEKSAGVDAIDTLIFLASPDDVEESWPEDRALFRSALRNNVLYLTTYKTASLWASCESEHSSRARRSSKRNPTTRYLPSSRMTHANWTSADGRSTNKVTCVNFSGLLQQEPLVSASRRFLTLSASLAAS